MFRLSKWFRRSYRFAIEENMARTRRSDLSTAGLGSSAVVELDSFVPVAILDSIPNARCGKSSRAL
jgi:hypothetical protein